MKAEKNEIPDMEAYLESLNIGRDAARVSICEHGQAVHHAFEDGSHADLFFQLRARLQERVERGEVELVREDLDDAIHEVRLRNSVLAVDHLLEDAGQHRLLVEAHVHALELADPNKVGPDQDAQVLALLLALLLPRAASLALHAHPEPVRLRKVLQHEVQRVVDGSPPTLPFQAPFKGGGRVETVAS